MIVDFLAFRNVPRETPCAYDLPTVIVDRIERDLKIGAFKRESAVTLIINRKTLALERPVIKPFPFLTDAVRQTRKKQPLSQLNIGYIQYLHRLKKRLVGDDQSVLPVDQPYLIWRTVQ